VKSTTGKVTYTGKAADVAATKVAAAGEATSTPMRTRPRWLSKTNKSYTY
jgi:hypothetical protein